MSDNDDDKVRTLRLRVATLRLSEEDDIEQRFPTTFGRIEVQADMVTVAGWIRLHGRDLSIHARCIEAHPVAGRPAVLDVSGAAAEPGFDPEAPSPKLNGNAKSPNGRAGRPGGPGRPGGKLTVLVDQVVGELGLAANGSAGGASERGGDGARPAPVGGADGKFLPGRWPTKGPHGGGVLQPPGLRKYVAWASGQRGGHARTGGAAGAPGQPGDGGAGGQVSLRFTGGPAPTLATIADGGAAGVAGQPAKPGPAGAPGAGGRNLIYAYDIFGTDRAFARSGKNKVVDTFARRFKIAARAPSGKTGAAAGSLPAQPAGKPGAAGQVSVEADNAADLAAVGMAFGMPLLRLLLTHADALAAAGEVSAARQRYRWLAGITDAQAKHDPAIAEIWQTASDAAASLTEVSPPEAKPARRRRSRSAARR